MSDLLDKVFAEAEEYNLSYMTSDEFTAQMAADRDPDGQSSKKWNDVFKKMAKDGKLTKRYARHPENNRRVVAYKLAK